MSARLSEVSRGAAVAKLQALLRQLPTARAALITVHNRTQSLRAQAERLNSGTPIISRSFPHLSTSSTPASLPITIAQNVSFSSIHYLHSHVNFTHHFLQHQPLFLSSPLYRLSSFQGKRSTFLLPTRSRLPHLSSFITSASLFISSIVQIFPFPSSFLSPFCLSTLYLHTRVLPSI